MTQQVKTQLTISKWILYTSLGWLVGFVLAVVAGEPLDQIKLSIAGMGIGIAVGVGLMQWVILRKQIANAGKWILLSVMGLGGMFLILNILQLILGFFNVGFMGDGLSFLIPAIIGSSVGGYLNGLLQEKYILRKVSNQSKSWALTSAMAWFCAILFLTVFFTIFTNMHPEKTMPEVLGPLPVLIIFFSIGPILGLCTGKKIVSILGNVQTTSN